MSEYQSLEVFTEKKNPYLWRLIMDLPPAERIERLRRLLLDFAQVHRDENETTCVWEVLMRAVDDFHFTPIIKEVNPIGGRKTIIVRHACPADSEATAVHLAQRQHRVVLAQEIFAAIPAFQEKLEWDRQRGENYSVKKSTLPAIKKLIWTEIASWWRDAVDDQESLAMLDWLLTLEVKFAEERDTLREIVRDKSKCMSDKRLLAGMLRIKQYRDNPRGIGEGDQMKRLHCNDTDEWLKLMLHAWINQQKPLDIINQLTALVPVAAHGPMAWDLLRQLAQPLGEFCLQARLLQDFINPPGGFNSIFDAATVVRYEKVGEAIVEVNANNEPYRHDQNSADIKLAGKIGEKLGEWMKRHPGIMIFARIGYRSTITGQEFRHRMEFWVS